jgi:predicted nucleic acid-binding protein
VSAFTLVDSSAWIHALRAKGDPGVRARVAKLLNDRTAAWCEMVRVELWCEVRNDKDRKALQGLDRALPRLPIDDRVWDAATVYASKARAAGLTVPATDMVIFACAAIHRAPIEHDDHHYELLKPLR